MFSCSLFLPCSSDPARRIRKWQSVVEFSAEVPTLVVQISEVCTSLLNSGVDVNLDSGSIPYRSVCLVGSKFVIKSYVCLCRLYDWGPYIPEDMQWFIGGLYDLLIGLISSKSTEYVSQFHFYFICVKVL